MGVTPVAHRDKLQAVVVGSLTRDQIIRDGTCVWRIGGVVWYAGTSLARLGINTRVVTRTALEHRGLADELRSAGVEVQLGTSAQTTTFINYITTQHPNERGLSAPALADPIEAGDLSRALADADLVYLGPLHPNDLGDGALAAVQRQRPALLALDVQGYTRSVSDGRIVPKLDDRLTSLLAACDVIKASQDEACVITGIRDPGHAALHLARSHSRLEVVVTCGTNGVYVAQQQNVHFEPAVPADVPDPTGAGDVFFAAYLAQRLKGVSRDAAAAFAVRFTADRLGDPDHSVRLPDDAAACQSPATARPR